MESASKLAAFWALSALLLLGVGTATYARDPQVRSQDERRGGDQRGGDQRGGDRQNGDRGREHDGRGEWLDSRFNHGHYYPEHGAVVRALPPGYRPYYHDGARFYFNGGVWYAPRPGGAFIVTRPPVGLFLNILPPFYTTVWFGGLPYYYADDVYYSWRPDLNGYVVADPPEGADSDSPGAPPANAAPAEDFYMYPKNGQTTEQQAADRYECHSWARSQTGFDPTAEGGGVPANENVSRRADYKRAMGACLEARGYSVK